MAAATLTMVPDPSVLPNVLPTDTLNARGMPSRALRDELRQIPAKRNVVTLVGALAQSFGLVVAASVVHTWWSYLLAFVLMARGHVCLAILGHEAAHRLLFPNRTVNDFVGRWLVGYPTLQPMLLYRRAHFAHHKDEMGPAEPDSGLYAGYPITRSSWKRKLFRDLRGNTAKKDLVALVKGARGGVVELRQVLIVQAAMASAAILAGRPLAYVVWIGSWATLWRFSNRLRAIAEHGGMTRSRDRRETTHVIRQSRLARFWMVPYNTGWHLAHHADMGVPWRNLPKLHAELVAAGWVTDAIEYRSYMAFWRAASSRPEQHDTSPDQAS